MAELQKKAYSVSEMAEVIGIGRDKAYNLVHRDDFPAIKIGTSYIIPVANLNQWLLRAGKERLEI